MHTCIYVLITGPNTQTEEFVAEALAPFDGNLEVPPYKLHLSHSGVRAIAGHFGLPESDLESIARKMPDWMGCAGGVDDLGLFASRTSNPNGKFDWYQIGGRWDGKITGKAGAKRPKHDVLARNCLLSSALLAAADFERRIPHGVVMPTGEWVERTTFVSTGDGWYSRETADPHWCDHFRRILAAFPKHQVVCVDVHF
jgi:hypothetical protein